ncbi:MAG: hypothetical protein ACKO7R_03825, partial [Pseudanabaena sp.]
MLIFIDGLLSLDLVKLLNWRLIAAQSIKLILNLILCTKTHKLPQVQIYGKHLRVKVAILIIKPILVFPAPKALETPKSV